MIALGRLLRISLAPSAVADVAAGLVLAHGGTWPSGAGPFWLMASSACVYHGALALNDWRDRELDARVRPARPIPSGAVAAHTALALGTTLLALGPLLALLQGKEAACWSLGLALLALSYDFLGRGAWLGPALLALCRAGNLGLGLFFASGAFATALPLQQALLPMTLYALLVFRVSQLGRMEDGEGGELRTRVAKGLVLSAAAMLALLPLLPPFDERVHSLPGRLCASAIAGTAAFTLFRTGWSRGEWTRADVERAMGLCLRRFLAFTAALAALAWQPPALDALIVAALILAGYAVSARLRAVFPPS